MKTIAQIYGFKGGRFYRNRYVQVFGLYISSLPAWFDNRISSENQFRIKQILDGIVQPQIVCKWRRTRRDDGCNAQEYLIEDGDKITIPLFGVTSEQFFNRMMANRYWTVRNRFGLMWWCLSKDMASVWRRRDKGSMYDRVPNSDVKLFEKFEGETPRYDGLDFGPNRLPPVWVCNLCGHTAEWKEWPISDTPGLANSDYISKCPKCKAERGDFFNQVKTAMQEIGALPAPVKKGFLPTMKMQDNLFYYPPPIEK